MAGTVSYGDIAPIFGIIISKGLATLNELDTVYDYDDALMLYDIIRTDNYNHNLVEKNIKSLHKT